MRIFVAGGTGAIGRPLVRALVDAVSEGRSELELAAAAYHALLSNGSGLPASTSRRLALTSTAIFPPASICDKVELYG